MRRVRVKRYDTEVGAQKWARAFDYARKLHRLPLLEVEQDAEGWWVVNPNVDKIPITPVPIRKVNGR